MGDDARYLCGGASCFFKTYNNVVLAKYELDIIVVLIIIN